ncbi:MAG TPA: site-specific tyrosine recombinase XerD [Pseudolysinimonas sp.]|nr:site-specific tyrosine recombinase XerD [Pseudolysinimonas sp.]
MTHQLDRYLRHVAIERGRSHNTVSAYRRDLEGFLAYLTAQPGERSDVTTDTVTDYLRSLRERPSPLAATSLARTLSSIRGFARFLVDEGMLSSDPTAQSHPPKAPQRLPKALTIEQIAALLATSGGDEPTELRDAALLELLYATGARISEVVALNLDDIVGDDGTGVADMVRLFGKGGKQRIVPVGSYARSALDAYLVRARPVLSSRGRATPALFLGARGARLSRQNSWLIIRAAAERADLRVAVSPHTFRHSFATHLLQGGADVRVVQELLGHASVATTQIYTRVTADALRDVYVTAHPRARRADRGS